MRVVIPSNCSREHYPNNTLAKFTVQLPQAIDLSRGRWEVGLTEIQFYKSWYNIVNAKIICTLHGVRTEISLDDGYYKSPEFLINKLNECVKKNKIIARLISFGFNEITRSCELTININQGLIVNFNQRLKSALGFSEEELVKKLARFSGHFPTRGDLPKEITISGSHPMRLDTIFNMMVYSDVAESSLVGDVEAPLLRVVPVIQKHWRYQCTEFTTPQYIPVSQKNVKSISMYIYTDYGQLVPFTDGRTIVTLDFRKTNPLYG